MLVCSTFSLYFFIVSHSVRVNCVLGNSLGIDVAYNFLAERVYHVCMGCAFSWLT